MQRIQIKKIKIFSKFENISYMTFFIKNKKIILLLQH